ncbi:MAG TPA: dialkylresorcinol condensing enzyme [Burkholderiaceae bacterium]|nr:dialkylresorcinol condensing enzyme [Burkholderiaceae bacterium]
MVKKVLAAHFSQAGQAAAVLASIVAPLREAGDIELTEVALDVVRPYPFPWPFWRFLDAFPETVHLDAPSLAPLPLRGDEDFDLIVLAYPVWFLSPPPPIAAFLRHPTGRALLRGKPVVTVTACRNMWVMAQQTVKQLLREAGARHIDQVVLTDRSHPLATFITTPRWLLTGRRDAFWGLPPAGVSEQQIRAARRFGLALRDGLRRDDEKRGAPMLSGLRACEVDPRLVASERIGIRSFRLWGAALRALGPPGAPARRALLAVYLVFLISMIVTVVPLNMLARRLLAPFSGARMQRLRRELEAPSGSGGERLEPMSG